MKDIINKYKDMANMRDDFYNIEKSNYITPTMGEMIQEDLMSEIYKQYVEGQNSDGAEATEKDILDAAYYIEDPITTNLGFDADTRTFILKANALNIDNFTWSLNKYDGDTTAYKLDDINDGGTGFVINNVSYKNFKSYYNKLGGSSSLTIRHVGIDTPEVPHLEIQATPKSAAFFNIETMTFEEVKIAESKKKKFVYLKYPIKDNKPTHRSNDEVMKFLKATDEKGVTVYHEILDDLKHLTKEVPMPNAGYDYHVIVNKDESTFNTVQDGYKAQEIIKDKLSKAKEILLVVDANGLSISKTVNNTGSVYNSIYYTGEIIDFLLEQWDISYKDIPSTNYKYNAYGSDKYGRSLGAIYIREEYNGQNVWINLNKYVAAKTEFCETNPSYNSSPELQEINSGLSDAFKTWSYDKDNVEWLDSFNKLSSKSYYKRLEIHKKLLGYDFTEMRDCALLLGDTMMLIPPESIKNVTQSYYEKIPNMRSKGTMAKSMGHNEHMLELTLYFYDEAGINGIEYNDTTPNGTEMKYYMNGLRSLIAQFKISPFLPIENGYINDVLGIEAVSLLNLNIENVEGFPRLLKTTLLLKEFNYRIYMPDIPIDDTTDNEDKTTNDMVDNSKNLTMLNPMFAKCFDWDIFRYYYQRALRRGDELDSIVQEYGFDSYDYNLKFYASKNAVAPMRICDSDIRSNVSFYVPDQSWLDNALEVKKQRENNYTTNESHVILSNDALEWLKGLDPLKDSIKTLSKNEDLIVVQALKKIVSKHNPEEGVRLRYDKPFFFDKDKGTIAKNVTVNYNTNVYYDIDGEKDIKGSEFVKSYLLTEGIGKSLGFYDSIKAAINTKENKLVNSVTLNEITKFSKESNCYYITWQFLLGLDTSSLIDSDWTSIREALSKSIGADLKDIFVDGAIRLEYKMTFDNATMNIKLGQDGISNESTDSIKFNSTTDLKALDAVEQIYHDNTGESLDGEEGKDDDYEGEHENEYNRQIDYFVHDYKNPANMPFVPYIQDVLMTNVTANLSNTFTNIALKAVEGQGPQYVGGQDTELELEIVTDDMVVVSAINSLPNLASSMAKRYRRVLPAWPIKIKSDLTQMLGVNEVLIDTIEVTNVIGFPGVYKIVMRLTSVDRTQRQREALRRLDVAPTGGNVDYNGHSNLSIQSYFNIEASLSKAELYPDLDLPTLEEMGKLGYRYVKYSSSNRLYPDPDFYIVYAYPYTSLIIKDMIQNVISKKILTDESEDEAIQDIQFEGSMGEKFVGKITNFTGIGEISNQNDIAKEYDEILETHMEDVRKKIDTDTRLNDTQKDVLKDAVEFNEIIKYLTLCDVYDGWEIKPGWYAPLAEKALNKEIEIVEKTKHVYAQDIKTLRKDAIGLIDEILSKPITYRNGIGEPKFLYQQTAEHAVNELFFNNEKGKELIQLLCPNCKIKKLKTEYLSNSNNNWAINPSDDKFNKAYFEDTNPLKFLAGFLFTAGCSISSKQQYSTSTNIYNWSPNHWLSDTELGHTIKDIETNLEMPYCVRDDVSGAARKAIRLVDAIDYGTVFGAWRITNYASSNDIASMFDRKEQIMYGGPYYDITYKDKNDLNKKEYQRINQGFVDPYYNYAGHKSQTVKKYKESILKSKQSNAEAFLRVMLVHLRHMILDGLLISEIDLLARDYDEIMQGFDDMQSDFGASMDDFINEFGMDEDEYYTLIKSIKESTQQGFCARLIYPFIAAANNNSKDVYDLFMNREYSSLNSLTGYIEVSDKLVDSKNKTAKFLSVLGGIGLTNIKEGKNESKVSTSQSLVNSLMKDIYIESAEDPRLYLMHSFYDMLINDKRGRLVRAFPTYYVVFVDEGRKIGSWKLHDNFYNMSSISEIQVVKSRKIASDTCRVVMNNMFNSYTTEPDVTTTQQYLDVYGLRDVFDSIFSPRAYFEKEKAIRLRQTIPEKVVLAPGIRIHVRMGYTADGSKLPIVFNGKVAEVAVDSVAEIVAQGDGHELMNPLNAFGDLEVTSLETSQSYITWFRDIRGSLARGGETPRNLLAKLLTAKHGGVKRMLNAGSDGRWFNDNPFGIMHFGDQQFNSIWDLGEVVQNLYEVADNTIIKGMNELAASEVGNKMSPIINTTLQDKTLWDILHLCANSGLEYVGAVRDFGFRSTIFLGKNNHYYAYGYDLIDNKVVERRKPFQQFHYYDSYNDIVYNSIKASEAQMKTNAVGIWQSTAPLWGKEQSTVGPIYLDMNIYPEYQKTMTVDTGLIAAGDGGIDIPIFNHYGEEWNMDANDNKVNKSTAWRVTANTLKNSIKDMYQGDICVIGDPSVKPYDRCYIHDSYEDMQGMFEVEGIVHTMSVETGFTTSILPDVIARHDDKYEPVVTNLLGNVCSVLGVAVGSRLAKLSTIAALNNKLVTTIAKSSNMYGINARVNKLGKDLMNASGMNEFLETKPLAKEFMQKLEAIPSAKETDLYRMSGLIDTLSDLELKNSNLDIKDLDNFVSVIKNYSDLDVDVYKQSLIDAKNQDKYGLLNGKISEDEFLKTLDKIDIEHKQMEALIEVSIDKTNKLATSISKAISDADINLPADVKSSLNNMINGNFNKKDLSKVLGEAKVKDLVKNKKVDIKLLDSLHDSFKPVFSVKNGKTAFKAASSALKGGDLLGMLKTVLSGVLKINPASFALDIVIGTVMTVFTRNVKEMFTRWLQEIQAVSVYPLYKNNKPLIAGMNGHKGSVAMYPTIDGYNSIQGMVLETKEWFDKYGLGFLLDWFIVDGNVLNQVANEWRYELGLTNTDDKVNETYNQDYMKTEDFNQEMYSQISQSYAAKGNHAYALKTRARLQSFDRKPSDNTDAKETYDHYKIQNISEGGLVSNPNILKLLYIGDDEDIKKAILKEQFVIAHENAATKQISLPLDNGTVVVPIISKDNEIDMPLVQEELLYILKKLVNYKSLNKGVLHFKSGTVVNSSNAWKDTGFVMTIEYNKLGTNNDLKQALDEIKSDLTYDAKVKDSKGESKLTQQLVFDYKYDGKDKFVIAAYPPLQTQPKVKEDEKENDTNE